MNTKHFIKERLSTRSLKSSFRRVFTLFHRYGFSTEKFVWSLNHFVSLTQKYHVVPTLPVTASVVDRHPQIFQKIQKQNVELAIHGRYHIDYTKVNIDDTQDHLCQAISIFHKHHIQYSGYRFPFLKKNNESIALLKEPGFLWDSSEVISWNSLNSRIFHPKNWADYEKILETYKAIDADQVRSLPYMKNGLVEIPISVPDDDILIERLGIQDEDFIYAIWQKMISCVRDRKELLVLQMHPERYNIFKNALRGILKYITKERDVWIASLGEIAQWWKERSAFQIKIKKLNNNRYQIVVDCAERAGILINNGTSNDFNQNSKEILRKGNWEIESPKKPIIGVDPDTDLEIFNLLKREGYPFEISTKRHEYNLFIKHTGKFDLEDENQLLQLIDHQYPLINFWRWPNGYRYGFAITGDIDGVDLWDYGERFYG